MSKPQPKARFASCSPLCRTALRSQLSICGRVRGHLALKCSSNSSLKLTHLTKPSIRQKRNSVSGTNQARSMLASGTGRAASGMELSAPCNRTDLSGRAPTRMVNCTVSSEMFMIAKQLFTFTKSTKNWLRLSLIKIS